MLVPQLAVEYEDKILDKKGIIVVPDVLANSGGVIVSYFEWLQNMENESWAEEEVTRKLKAKITKAFDDTWKYMEDLGTNMRMGAYALGVSRVVEELEKK
ncbi:hypothetical protein JXA34_03280 [Patescibacteria group bacterium]|nr:hypothetical protein [Patescibacteria group bacterium]